MASWKYKLFACGCDKTCLLGSFLPCVTYGHIQQRLQNEDDDEIANCSPPCRAWCILAPCSLSILLQYIQRRKIKERQGIEKNCCFDVTTSCCCGPCSLIQEYKEVRDISRVEVSQPQRPPPMTTRREE